MPSPQHNKRKEDPLLLSKMVKIRFPPKTTIVIMMENIQKRNNLFLLALGQKTRDRLRCTLEQWKEERKQFRRSGISTDNRIVDDPGDEEQEDKNDELVFSWKSLEDPDLLLVTIPLATLFTLLSFLLPSRTIIQQQQQQDYDSSTFTKRQQAVAIVILGSSVFSAWITKRRRKVSRETDRSIERRRCVSAFLDGMKKKRQSDNYCQEEEEGNGCDDDDNADADSNMKNLTQIQTIMSTLWKACWMMLLALSPERMWKMYILHIGSVLTTIRREKDKDNGIVSQLCCWYKLRRFHCFESW